MSSRRPNVSRLGLTGVLPAIIALALSACGRPDGPASDATAEESAADPRTLTPESTNAEITSHMLWLLENQTKSTELTTDFPDIDRRRAYDIQRLRLEQRELSDERVGWKIGWSNQPDPEVELDPAFGHIMASDVLEPGAEVPSSFLIDGRASLEAEVVFWLDENLPGPEVTREDVIAATKEVAAAIEIIEPRLTHTSGELDWPNRHTHGVIDNVWHLGVVPGPNRVSLDDVDLAAETVTVTVNDDPPMEGRFGWTMGRDPIEGVVWLANEMLEYGHQLRAGDFVITGSVVYRPGLVPGDTATLEYSSLGTMKIALADASE